MDYRASRGRRRFDLVWPEKWWFAWISRENSRREIRMARLPRATRGEKSSRTRGIANKITRDIREGCIAGFAAHGLDGKGKLGFPGYIQFLATKHPKTASRLIEKLLPFVVNAPGFVSPTISTINVVSIPSGEYLSKETINHLQHQGSHAIDRVPALEHHTEPAPVEVQV
jgi:hypothetical protein